MIAIFRDLPSVKGLILPDQCTHNMTDDPTTIGGLAHDPVGWGRGKAIAVRGPGTGTHGAAAWAGTADWSAPCVPMPLRRARPVPVPVISRRCVGAWGFDVSSAERWAAGRPCLDVAILFAAHPVPVRCHCYCHVRGTGTGTHGAPTLARMADGPAPCVPMPLRRA